ncbi:DUF3619 family protein [Aromatoleum anaerobium]|uniref:DUF3619 family protein n=1 Tax=Aromatoleum anaerobium TaxID=182180 RepID=A0ABX1PJ30_9RHOO|nr:DUF3619 family protein [Aromatoleum anaerobium]MCK0505599.1 DUF3619 family protein [Aromatoleum anaerobium]
MNEQEFGHKLAVHLSAATREIDGELADRLRSAREEALRASSRAGRPGRLFGRKLRFRLMLPAVLRPAVLVFAVLATVLAGDYWVTWSRVNSLQEVDTALLIDDLPIDAYLDADFKAWLQQDSQS